MDAKIKSWPPLIFLAIALLIILAIGYRNKNPYKQEKKAIKRIESEIRKTDTVTVYKPKVITKYKTKYINETEIYNDIQSINFTDSTRIDTYRDILSK